MYLLCYVLDAYACQIFPPLVHVPMRPLFQDFETISKLCFQSSRSGCFPLFIAHQVMLLSKEIRVRSASHAVAGRMNVPGRHDSHLPLLPPQQPPPMSRLLHPLLLTLLPTQTCHQLCMVWRAIGLEKYSQTTQTTHSRRPFLLWVKGRVIYDNYHWEAQLQLKHTKLIRARPKCLGEPISGLKQWLHDEGFEELFQL